MTYVVPSLIIGGAETQLIRLVNHLDRDRFQASVVCPFGYGPMRSQLNSSIECRSLSRTVRRPLKGAQIRVVTAMHGLLSGTRPDIVHAYLMPAYVLAALASWRAGVGVLIASRRGLDTFPRRPSSMLRLAARLANQLIDFHLCNSEAVRRLVMAEEGIAPAKTGVIYNGIDLPETTNGVDSPDEWGLRDSDGCAAMIANYHTYKRHIDVIEAVKLIVTRRPRFKLVVFGDGLERGSIERLVSESGLKQNVVLAGARLDAADLLPGFDVTILASSKEGFPNALMESMAHGVPVVATRAGGIPELVRDGIDGKLVDVASPEQVSSAVMQLLDSPNLRRRMGAAGRSRIGEKFSVTAMVTHTESLYLRLLSQRAERRFGINVA